jgi:hypothetical protein
VTAQVCPHCVARRRLQPGARVRIGGRAHGPGDAGLRSVRSSAAGRALSLRRVVPPSGQQRGSGPRRP